jgi:hypothetical protein
VQKTVVVNVSSGGTISGNQSGNCSYNPSNITSSAAASGGSGASITYQWQRNTGSWANISGATGATYDPGTISVTTQYRRRARRSPCGWVNSNVITKTVNGNFTNAGGITGAQTNCGAFNPTNMTSTSNPSGGAGGSTLYQWQISTTSAGAGFSNIGGATGSTYDPPSNITQTTWYRRGARRGTGCSFIYTAAVQKTVVSNVTGAGSISGDETECLGFNPSTISSTTPASGGSGAGITYRWQFNNGGGWTNIGSSNSVTYDPPAITVTTQYRRQARRSPCGWLTSAVVTKTVGTSSGGNPNGTVTWTGNIGTDWTDACNWSPEVVPTTGSTVVIPGSTANMPSIGAAVTANCFSLDVQGNSIVNIDADGGATLNIVQP